MAKILQIQKEIKNTLLESTSNTDSVTADVNTLAQWIQVVGVASTPNSGAVLNVLYSPPILGSFFQLLDEDGAAVTIDLNSTDIIKLNDISIDQLKFVPSNLSAGTYKVVVSVISEIMNKI